MSRYFQIKIGSIVQKKIDCINPQFEVILKQFVGQTTDTAGRIALTTLDIPLKARVQSVTRELIFSYNLELGKTYKTFFVLRNDITTASRVIETNTDYLFWNNTYWRVMHIVNEYDTDWQELVCMQTDKVT